MRKLRLPAICCALAVLVCELISHPYANIGISDDGPYILMAQTLASTGHIVYNGWAAAMIGWQLYIGAAFIKLFGFSFTAVRMSTLFVSLATAFLLQRTLVRCGITERNAVVATLALSLSPLYLLLSVTYMSDLFGLFAMLICLYGCLRALQAATPRNAILWLCFAVATNAFFGTARQIAWLGVLVMVPSTLWLLRTQRRALIAGCIATLAGALSIYACMQWLKHQPYVLPPQPLPHTFSVLSSVLTLIYFLLAIPFLVLPIMAIFLPSLRKNRPAIMAGLALFLLGYLFLGIYPSHLRGGFPLEPTMGGGGNWISVHGIHEGLHLQGNAPLFLNVPAQVVITIICFSGLFAVLLSLLKGGRLEHHRAVPSVQSAREVSWKQLSFLLGPFALAYTALLIPRTATGWIYDRYTLELGLVALIFMVRYYQEEFQPRIPPLGIALVAAMAVLGVAITHNHFSLYRARVALAAELHANGIPDTAIDQGFEQNFIVELQHSDHINDETIVFPSNAYLPVAALPAGTCKMFWHEKTPIITPLYGISFDPDACHGLAPFTPVHYTRWLASTPESLYVVRYTSAAGR